MARRTDAEWLGEKSEAEQRLWEAYPHGTVVEYQDDEEIRAEVVAALALGAAPALPGRTAGVRIRGARVVGELDLRHGTVRAPLTMLACTFTHALRLEEAETRSIDLSGSRLAGLRATGTHVRGSINLKNAEIIGTDVAAQLQLLTVDTDFNAVGLHCVGLVNLVGAHIGAVLDLNDALLENPGELALNLGGAVVHRSLYCARARIAGHLRMPGLTVGGVLSLTGTVLTDPPTEGPFLNQSVSGDSLSTGGDAMFDEGFTAAAQVDLSGATFGGRVLFKRAQMNALDRHPALALAGATVRRGLYIGDGFHANGTIRLTGIQISGHLDLYDMKPSSGMIQLYQAHAATVRDGKIRGDEVHGGVVSWPQTVLLDGFSYDAFDPYLPAQERIKLLRRQPQYAAQPYEFMAAYFRALGHDAAGREILIEKERVRHRDFHRLSRIGSVISGTALGYGYLPRRAAFLALGIQVAASVFYSFAIPTAIHPGDRIAYDPVLYAADLFVPIVHFGQSDSFQSHGFAAWVAFALPYLGWALGVAIVAGASRALSKGGGGIV
ncbi:hypothetical protein KDL01_20910 [Actinospica durhamensis]|uniref:Membrane-associated oxidoreductase n=1 Tax=Actinospica durhamensis TaxID=1508375 RepID=A0A941ESP1_9ACTN|nr:hypothetical protein [Actinospica durhamensis]MBR7835747.1 hypothetical protein [Actinospica durhamensis]